MAGRRFGKDVLLLDQLIRPALDRGLPVGYFAPTHKNLLEFWRGAVRTLVPVTARANATDHRLELVTGGVVEMWSLDAPDAARGRRYARVAINEAGVVERLESAWSEVIRATLADYAGDAWFGGTPKGMNFFHTLYQRGMDAGEPDWASWQRPTSANPFIAPAELAALAAELSERTYAQEILAQFVEDGAGVFRSVRAAATARPEAPIAGHQYVIGVDWGRSHDFTVMSVLDATTTRQVWLERSNQVEYAVQRGRLAALCARYRPLQVSAEANAMGEPIIEQLQRDGLPMQPFVTTNASKAAIIDGLALALERGTLTLLDDAVQTAELLAYTSERLPSGLVRYGAPAGGHDDTVIALALALAATRAEPLEVWFA